jgi:hypothetical protein
MDIWGNMRSLQGKTLQTLDRRNRFDVTYVGSDVLLVKPHVSGIERKIQRTVIEAAFVELSARGELSRVDIRERYSEFNPAYVVAILSTLPGITVEVRPIRLLYKGVPTPR